MCNPVCHCVVIWLRTIGTKLASWRSCCAGNRGETQPAFTAVQQLHQTHSQCGSAADHWTSHDDACTEGAVCVQAMQRAHVPLLRSLCTSCSQSALICLLPSAQPSHLHSHSAMYASQYEVTQRACVSWPRMLWPSLTEASVLVSCGKLVTLHAHHQLCDSETGIASLSVAQMHAG